MNTVNARLKPNASSPNTGDVLLNSDKFPSWRTQTRRRQLVIAAAASLLLFLIGEPLNSPVLKLPSLLLFFAALILLRITTRGVADFPDSALDERQVAIRNAAYLGAYRVVGGLVALITAGLIAYRVFGSTQLSADLAIQLMIAVLFAALAAPSCLVAWSEREA